MNPSGEESAHVTFSEVGISFEGREVFRRLSCRFPRGKISVILGGSGSGKTTILRLVGGLIRPIRGRITVAGQDINGLTETAMYAARQKLGMMFQGGALLDSLTVFDNLAFPLREHTAMSERDIAAEVHRQLAAVGLSDVDGLLPGQLSGGMIKRVALARAIITKPEILLCDEPFSGLDPISVKRIESLLHTINQQLGITMLIASHHVASTMRLADRVVLLLDHHAVSGSPDALLRSPYPSIAEFLHEGDTVWAGSPATTEPGRASLDWAAQR